MSPTPFDSPSFTLPPRANGGTIETSLASKATRADRVTPTRAYPQLRNPLQAQWLIPLRWRCVMLCSLLCSDHPPPLLLCPPLPSQWLPLSLRSLDSASRLSIRVRQRHDGKSDKRGVSLVSSCAPSSTCSVRSSLGCSAFALCFSLLLSVGGCIHHSLESQAVQFADRRSELGGDTRGVERAAYVAATAAVSSHAAAGAARRIPNAAAGDDAEAAARTSRIGVIVSCHRRIRPAVSLGI